MKVNTTKLITERINRHVVTGTGDSEKIFEISFVNRLKKTNVECLEQKRNKWLP